MPLQLDGGGEKRVFGFVEQALGRSLGQGREPAQFGGQGVRGRFQLLVRDDFRDDAPLARLPAGDALRAHDDVLRPRDADHLLEARRAAGAGNLAQALLGEGVERRLRGDAEVAGERDLEADPEAVAAIGGDDGLFAPRGRGDVVGQLRDVLGRCFQKAANEAARGEVRAESAEHDHPHPVVAVETLERGAHLLALPHRNGVHVAAVKNDVAALPVRVHLDREAVEARASRILKRSGRQGDSSRFAPPHRREWYPFRPADAIRSRGFLSILPPPTRGSAPS